MRLKILRDENVPKEIEDCYVVPTSYLQYTTTHLYLASQHWDSVHVELDEIIPIGTLSHVCKDKEVSVDFPATISRHIMKLLTEVYPDKAGLIRKEFMKGGDIKCLVCT